MALMKKMTDDFRYLFPHSDEERKLAAEEVVAYSAAWSVSEYVAKKDAYKELTSLGEELRKLEEDGKLLSTDEHYTLLRSRYLQLRRRFRVDDTKNEYDPSVVDGSYETIPQMLERYGSLQSSDVGSDFDLFSDDNLENETVFPQYLDSMQVIDFVDFVKRENDSIIKRYKESLQKSNETADVKDTVKDETSSVKTANIKAKAAEGGAAGRAQPSDE